MARRHRFHKTNATYHVMLRGNNGQSIFACENDKAKMCLLIQKGIERFGHSVEAFCFMSNHIHLAVRVTITSISRIMQHLAFCYTRYFNRQYKRIGHLFQGRFKSVLVDEEEYLKELIRYIHLNPVRAKLESLPQQYRWSSHNAYMGSDEFYWLTKDRVLMKFDSEQQTAIQNLEKYILQGIGIETEFDFKTGCAKGILGDEDFISEKLITIQETPKEIELINLIAKVCEINNITQEQLCMPGKTAKYSQARALLAFLVREIDYISLKSLAEVLGRDSSTLAKLASHFESKIIKDSFAAENAQIMRQWIRNLTWKYQNAKPDPKPDPKP